MKIKYSNHIGLDQDQTDSMFDAGEDFYILLSSGVFTFERAMVKVRVFKKHYWRGRWIYETRCADGKERDIDSAENVIYIKCIVNYMEAINKLVAI